MSPYSGAGIEVVVGEVIVVRSGVLGQGGGWWPCWVEVVVGRQACCGQVRSRSMWWVVMCQLRLGLKAGDVPNTKQTLEYIQSMCNAR
jgi:hypothetical protein